MSRRRAVVTGLGALAPNGNDAEAFWEALTNGQSGIAQITQFDTTNHDVKIAGEVKDFDPTLTLDRKEARRTDPFVHFAVAAAQEAFEHSGLQVEKIDVDRFGVIIGSGIGGIKALEDQHRVLMEKGPGRVSPFLVPMMISDMSAGMVSMKLGAKGPNYSTVSACASGAHAIGEAARKIQYDDADIMVAGGAEAAVTSVALAGFTSAKALSKNNENPSTASRPFDADRDGFVMGEGAGALILEELGHARARGAEIWGEFLGLGFTADAYHQTAMAPGGEGGVRAMNLAIKDAGLDHGDIGYINAHGTSTPLGDPEETTAIKTAFGSSARELAISSTKSCTGHLLGAAGAIESVACIFALKRGVLPPTINLEKADPACDLDYVPNQAREKEIKTALNNSFGFGGHNAALAFARFED